MEKQRIRNLGNRYFTRRPISIHVYRDSKGLYNSEFPEGNLHTNGYKKTQAIDNLKSLIIDMYEILNKTPIVNLSSKLQKKKRILEDLVERIV